MKPQLPVEKTPLDATTNAKHPITDHMSPFFEAPCGRFHSRSRLPVFLQLLTGLWLLFGLMPLGLGSPMVVNGHHLEVIVGLGGFKPSTQPFLYLSDTEWLLNKYSYEKIEEILSTRAKQGFTVIKITVVELNWNASAPDGPHDYLRTDADGHRPFNYNNTNCLSFNEDGWWARLRNIVDMANDYGLWIELTIGGPGRRDPNPYQIPGDEGHPESFVPTAYEYGRLVGNRFADKTNVIFNIGCDTGADIYPSPIYPSDPRGIGRLAWEAMAKGVADGYNGVYDPNNPEANYDTSSTTQTFHPGWPDVNPYYHLSSSNWFHQAKWEDFNAIQTGTDASPYRLYDLVAGDYDRLPPKPTVLIETVYEGTSYNESCIPHTPPTKDIRLGAWHAMFAGAAGYTYGHVKNFAHWFNDCNNTPGAHDDLSHLTADGAVQISYLRNFLDSHDWWKFVPDHNQTVIRNYGGDGTTRLAPVKDSFGYDCYVYYPTRYPSGGAHVPEIWLNSVNGNGLLSTYHVEVKWFNPQDETETTAVQYAYPTVQSIAPEMPSGWEDGVLMLRNIGN